MYLACVETDSRQRHYILRESYRDQDRFLFRDLVDLGPNPGRFCRETGDSSFVIDEELLEILERKGLGDCYEKLEKLLFPFANPAVQRRMAPFFHRSRYRHWKPAEEQVLHRALHETCALDRRRLHFLRLGRTAPGMVEKTAALYIGLLDKSRDEIEQMIMAMEQKLPPRDYQSYLFEAFDLQRFFKESLAAHFPQILDRDRLDAAFVGEICRVAADRDFWAGFPEDRLPSPLVRYLIMYFDGAEDIGPSWARTRQSFRSRRFRPGSGAPKQKISRNEALNLFGLTPESLAELSQKELTRLYRRQAMHLHPDKGGDAERFIRLTAAYEMLLPSLR
ncbi:MAG: J domain-containing protein [Desulfobulbus sp.]|jgi:hypothetical protein